MTTAKYCWMIVTPGGNPLTMDYRLPIYWRKELAIQDADERTGGARVVKIPIPTAIRGEDQT